MTFELFPHAVVRSSPDSATADAWALVLEAVGIPHRVDILDAAYRVSVPVEFLARANAALDAQDRESREVVPPDSTPDLGRSYVGVAFALTIAAFFWVTGPRQGPDAGGWFRAGTAVAERIVAGEIWRSVTALTLHADIMHVLGNAAAGLIFISALGRWLGGGLALFVTLSSGVAGNLLTAAIYAHSHQVVGASTSTFGALGVLSGLQFVRRFRRPSVGRFRRGFWGVAAGLALLALLGAGERSDLLAHATGLGVGISQGIFLGFALKRPMSFLGQVLFMVATVLILGGAWYLARASI